MNKWIFASMLFLAAFVASIGTVSADEVAESAESETAETVEAEPVEVPKLFLFVVDPEGELHFEGTIAPDDPMNLKVSAYDAAGDVHLVSVRSMRGGCSVYVEGHLAEA